MDSAQHCKHNMHILFEAPLPTWHYRAVPACTGKLIKFWLKVGNKEQERRLEARIEDPLRQWKLSPTDLESRRRWYDYSRARGRMLEATDTAYAPWYIVRSDNKRRARLNCIAHLLSLIPYDRCPAPRWPVPPRAPEHEYDDKAPLRSRRFVPERY